MNNVSIIFYKIYRKNICPNKRTCTTTTTHEANVIYAYKLLHLNILWK